MCRVQGTTVFFKINWRRVRRLGLEVLGCPLCARESAGEESPGERRVRGEEGLGRGGSGERRVRGEEGPGREGSGERRVRGEEGLGKAGSGEKQGLGKSRVREEEDSSRVPGCASTGARSCPVVGLPVPLSMQGLPNPNRSERGG